MLHCPICGRISAGICSTCLGIYVHPFNDMMEQSRLMTKEIERHAAQPWYQELQREIEGHRVQMDKIRTLAEEFQEMLDRPEVLALRNSIQEFRSQMEEAERGAASWGATHQPTASEFQSQLMAAMPSALELEAITRRIPISTDLWLSSQSAQEVFAVATAASRAMAEDPYSDSTTAILRAHLGDWRFLNLDRHVVSQSERPELRRKAGSDPNIEKTEENSLQVILAATEIKLLDAPPVLAPSEEVEQFAVQSNEDIECYKWLRYIEELLRKLIETVLERAAGAKWIKQRIPHDIRLVWEERRKKSMDAKDSDRQHSLIYYADFNDYPQIIVKGDNWPLFEAIFKRKESLQESFYRISPFRNDLSHGRPLTAIDRYFFEYEIRRLLEAIKAFFPQASSVRRDS